MLFPYLIEHFRYAPIAFLLSLYALHYFLPNYFWVTVGCVGVIEAVFLVHRLLVRCGERMREAADARRRKREQRLAREEMERCAANLRVNNERLARLQAQRPPPPSKEQRRADILASHADAMKRLDQLPGDPSFIAALKMAEEDSLIAKLNELR